MSDIGDRRQFLKGLFRAAAQAGQEVASGIESIRSVDPLGTDDPMLEYIWSPPERLPATPSRGGVTADQLGELLGELGLDARRGDAARLARTSLRLTYPTGDAQPAGPARLGGVPDVSAGFEWPTIGETPLSFLGQLDLRDVAALFPDSGVPATGVMLFFFDTEGRPDGTRLTHAGSCRVIVAQGELAPAATDHPVWTQARAIELSSELQLPRGWSPHVEPLDLDITEVEAWEDARARLAELQGVDLEDRSDSPHSLHRLGGYEDDLRGDMRLVCELIANGADLDDTYAFAHDRADELEPASLEWQLLLQLSADASLGCTWNDEHDRLFLWIRSRDLAAGDFTQVWAILS